MVGKTVAFCPAREPKGLARGWDGMDSDGLIHAGEGLDQVTWMDVRIENILPTPRHGKPVEINAYWYNALMIMDRVAQKLGIEFHILDAKKDFSDFVIDYFVEEYVNGRTPNPCIACNRYLKFDLMVKWAESFGADYIATGHYARVEYDKELKRYLLKKAYSVSKDQSYFLYWFSINRCS